MTYIKNILADIKRLSLLEELNTLLDEFEEDMKPGIKLEPLSLAIPHTIAFKIDGLILRHEKTFSFQI